MSIILKNQKGIGLVEVIAALGVSVIVLTSIVSLSLFTMKNSLQSKLLLEGSKIANRELELLRAYRDGALNWENGTDGFLDRIKNCYGGSVCHMEYSSGVSVGTGTGTDGAGAELVTRSFVATKTDGTSQLQSGDTAVRVKVTVYWNIGNDTKYTHLYTDLTNWSNK